MWLRNGFALSFWLALSFSPSGAAEKRLAITIDDVPIASSVPLTLADKQEITANLLAALEETKVPAVAFVNERKLLEFRQVDAHIALLEAWLVAGHELGNHTFDHVGLNTTKVEEMADAVNKGSVISRWLSERFQRPYRYFRHPFTQTGNTKSEQLAFEAELAEQQLKSVPFTIEHTDYLFSCLYDRLQEDEVVTQFVVKDYLNHLDEAIDAFETMSDELFARQIPQIWLIHANRLNANTLAEQLALFKTRGYEFITVEEALRDAAYQLDTPPSKKYGPSWLMRWARQLEKKLSVYGQPAPSERVMQAYRDHCD